MFAATFVRRALALAGVALAVAACDGSSTGPARTPLDGLTFIVGSDSAGNSPPPSPVGPATPGYFEGTVLGPSALGAGNDSLATAPRVSGATVAAYRLESGGTISPDDLGPVVASVVTGTNGRFVLPTLEGGIYVVTITPLSSSVYGGVWVTATAHATSHEFPWWVVLWKK